jgi:hypothetical protein
MGFFYVPKEMQYLLVNPFTIAYLYIQHFGNLFKITGAVFLQILLLIKLAGVLLNNTITLKN